MSYKLTHAEDTGYVKRAVELQLTCSLLKQAKALTNLYSLQSSALGCTEALIQKHCSAAVESLRHFSSSAEREALTELALYVAGRRR